MVYDKDLARSRVIKQYPEYRIPEKKKSDSEYRRIERVQRFIKLREEKLMTLEEIGKLEGISKQRVSQLLKWYVGKNRN